jgi:hypothetical protein
LEREVKQQSWLGEVLYGGEGPNWTVVPFKKKKKKIMLMIMIFWLAQNLLASQEGHSSTDIAVC